MAEEFFQLPLADGMPLKQVLNDHVKNLLTCIPACRRTPIASYITIRLNPKQTGNNESATPWQSATDVDKAVQRAECDEGIPPEANNNLKSHFLSTKKFNTTLIDCAASHASSPETNVGFAASCATKGLIFTRAVAVTLSSAIPSPSLRRHLTPLASGKAGPLMKLWMVRFNGCSGKEDFSVGSSGFEGVFAWESEIEEEALLLFVWVELKTEKWRLKEVNVVGFVSTESIKMGGLGLRSSRQHFGGERNREKRKREREILEKARNREREVARQIFLYKGIRLLEQ
ncbi:hypothetical protein L484_017559 [Morus notabilis]|uniref:Uncharacterized protein n=1 Tax=Morus notabilis TaxID=981085 RepID=W9R022_9ROSA|nr:hypothetical protein L484_017559 [Morus notabilis]